MKVKNYIVSVVALVLLDIFWIYFIMGRPYRQMIFLIQNEDMKINYMAGLLTYILMIFGLIWFVLKPMYMELKNMDKTSIPEKIRVSFLYGGLFGLVVHGIYNLTNASIFKNWSTKLMLFDTMWGVILYSAAAAIGTLF